MKRFLSLGFVLLLCVIFSGCGETYRPVIIPNPPTFPNPAAAHTVVSINDNGTADHGSAMVIDVSGDSEVSLVECSTRDLCMGFSPVHAVQQSASEVLVVNQADSITELNFSSTVISSTNTISLPTNSAPNFVAVAPLATTAYVTLPGYAPPSVGVVYTATPSMGPTIPVGNNPVALAVTPDNTKLYVANQGDGTISGFNTKDYSARQVCVNGLCPSPPNYSPIALSSAPIWLSARSDSQSAYVLEATSGTLASIGITSTTGPDTLTEYPALAVAGATTMTYDSNLNRLYIPGGQQMEIVDVSQTPPQLIKTIPIPPFTLPNMQNPVPATATAVAALPDGSRAYVSSYASITSQLNISSVSGDGTTATYAYTLAAGQNLSPGMTITVSNMPAQESEFNGPYSVTAIVSGTAACPGTCFQAPNTTTLASTPVAALGTGTNIFPQVTVVWATSNTIKTTIGIPGFPDATIQYLPGGLLDPYYAPVCVPPTSQTPPAPYRATFRFMMAAGGDSSRAYLSSCDGGNVNFIDTSTDTYFQNLPAPASNSRPPIPPSQFNPPQNPVFLLAGP
jgi:DNA-binding beta-propeller fold protein YncE